MAGRVEAEAGVGQPSVNTRVLVQITQQLRGGERSTSKRIPDALGNYSITGVAGWQHRAVHFDFYGPDGATRGKRRGPVAVPDGTIDSYPAPNVKLDATGAEGGQHRSAGGNSNSVASRIRRWTIAFHRAAELLVICTSTRVLTDG